MTVTHSRGRNLSTVRAALRVLSLLGEHPQGLEAAVVAKHLGKSLSSAYSVLGTLTREGFAEHVGSVYRLAGGGQLAQPGPLTLAARPDAALETALDELYLRTHERACLAVWRAGDLSVTTRGRQGQPRPTNLEGRVQGGLHALALGKAILAYRDDVELPSFEPRTKYTVMDAETWLDELERVRTSGIAVELEEFAPGFSGVAAPVFDAGGQAVAALGVIVPARRFPLAFTRLARAVREVAHAASLLQQNGQRQNEPVVIAHQGALPEPSAAPIRLAPVLDAPEVETLEIETPETVHAPERLQGEANLQDFEAERRRSLEQPQDFWADWARRFHWFSPWRTVREGRGADHRWFSGATTNVAFNALDRHATGARRNQLALIAVSGDGETQKLTYRELLEMVSRFAAALRGLGVQKGDRVAIYMPTGLEAVVAMLGSARIGAIHIALPAGLGASAVRERLEATGAKILVAADRTYQRGRVVSLVPHIEEAIRDLAIRVVWHGRGALKARLEFHALIAAQPGGAACEPVDAEHPLFILYTSGSTGQPKGVVHVHGGYMVGITYHLRQLFDLRDTDTLWVTADVGWIVGHSYGVYAPLIEGLTIVLREDSLEPEGVVTDTLERHGVNVLLTSPAWLRGLRRHAREAWRPHGSSLRLVIAGGESLGAELWHWTRQHLNAFVMDHWWQTETGGPVLGTPLTRPTRLGAPGLALPGVDAAVVDDAGNTVPDGVQGHLMIREALPHMLRGFWGNEAAYRDLWREGVYQSGDLAVRDADGYFTVLGRADDVIKAGDYRLSAHEIEAVLTAHPAVAEAVAVAAQDAAQRPSIKVFTVLRSREAEPEVREVLSAKLKSFLRRHFGPTIDTHEVCVVNALPRTRSGKVLRRVLRAWAEGQDPDEAQWLEDEP